MTHRNTHPGSKLLNIALFIVALILGSLPVHADGLIRHTVVKDDTLWDLSRQYLDSPWLWPELWEQNDAIENPNLIYPGDVLLISPNSIRVIRNTRMRTEKLSPKIRFSEPLGREAIPTIEPEAILPFIIQSIIVEPGELDLAAYVLQGVDDRIALGKDDRMYARGLIDPDISQYKIYRIGSPIIDKISGESYGIEGVHLGNATLVGSEGDVSVLEITRANQAIRPGDRILPIKKPILLPYYFPRKPDTQIDTHILKIPKGVNEAGRRDIVLISGGTEDGLEEGHVLEVFSRRLERPDPVTGEMMKLPDLKIGTLIVFSLYNKVSYAILMETTASVKIGDRASTP